MSDWVTAEIAASELGISLRRVYQLIDDGILQPAKKVRGRWVIARDAVKARKAEAELLEQAASGVE